LLLFTLTLPIAKKNVRLGKMKRVVNIIIIDLLTLVLSFFIIDLIKSDRISVYIPHYFTPFIILFVIRVVLILYNQKKLHPANFKEIRSLIVWINFLSFAVFITIRFASGASTSVSRIVMFGTTGLTFIIELIYAYTIKWLNPTEIKNCYGTQIDILPVKTETEIPEVDNNLTDIFENDSQKAIHRIIAEEAGENAHLFIKTHVDLNSPETLLLSTTTRFNILNHPSELNKAIINLKIVNNIRYINKFLETVNTKLQDGGIFIGCCETNSQRHHRILQKYPIGIRHLILFIDYIYNRVFSKIYFIKKIYFFLTKGRKRPLSKAEILGRLVSCGFEIRYCKDIDNLLFFKVRKVRIPCYDYNPSYGPILKMKRIGKKGRLFFVYKLRTMHPYAEYLQEYIYNENKLQAGGKFKDDFRISKSGRFLRKFWLDELPMLYNFVRGDVKLVGVRPLSQHYFSLYPDDFQKIRINYKPGLIPPFYSDLPKTLEDIIESEKLYLQKYDNKPFLTDLKYFFKAIKNIIFNKVHSN
jgi:lipopolysaccharide/colanic/teichoic acid biosynthesis glycosyltransferase